MLKFLPVIVSFTEGKFPLDFFPVFREQKFYGRRPGYCGVLVANRIFLAVHLLLYSTKSLYELWFYNQEAYVLIEDRDSNKINTK